MLPPPPPRTAWQRWGRNLLLFVLTVVSVFFVGGFRLVEAPGGGHLLGVDYVEGGLLVAGLISILLAHEMGHYLVALRYGVDATLPFFIPLPIPGLSLVGTLGAFIRIRCADPEPQGALRHRCRRPAGRLRRLPARALARHRPGRASSRPTAPTAASCSASRCCSSG